MNIKNLPWNDILDMADLLLEKGMDEDDIVGELSDMLDQLIDFSILVPNKAAGAALEAVDGLIFATALRIAVSIAKNQDPEARKQRRARVIEKTKRVPGKIKNLFGR